ncbi:putative colanic acid biosynthesis glycosyl transferase WcaA [Bienertia sinuspersici]
MALTPIVRQKVATNPSSKAKTGKRSTSKHNPSDSKSKKPVPASTKDKRKEYCDIDALKTLRIEETFVGSLTITDWGIFLTTKTPTSMRATLEFLSSLKVHMFPKSPLVVNHPSLSVTPQHWNEKELWRTISVEVDYDSKRSSVTSIRHPALRYVFKVFSNTIFGRQEGRGKIVQGGFITRIATYLDHREQLIRDGFVDGTDAVEVPPSWFKKKDGTTLWRIQNDEDEILLLSK